jgi:hypothetical protein
VTEEKAVTKALDILKLANTLQERWNKGEFSTARNEWGRTDKAHWYRASDEYKKLWLMAHKDIISDWKVIISNDEKTAKVHIDWNDNEVGRIGRLLAK